MSVNSRYLDGCYSRLNPAWHDDDGPWKATQVLKMIGRLQSFGPSTLASICDIGCGGGGVLAELRTYFGSEIDLVGYEPSPYAASIASSRSDLRIVNSTVSLCEERFDLVLALDVIEHVEDYFTLLRETFRLGHYFIFHIPLDMSVQSVLRSTPLINARETVGHIHYFSYATARAALVDMGFTILDEFYTAGGLEAPNRRLKTKLAGVPRRALFALRPHIAARLLGGFSLMVLASAM